MRKGMTEDQQDEVEGHRQVKSAADEAGDQAEGDDEVEAHRSAKLSSHKKL
jgi:hypothetical protein